MKSKAITFQGPQQVALVEQEFDGPVGDNDVLIRTEKSILSAGTELACLRGTESWAPFPFIPGYGSVGTVIAAGAGIEGLEEGDRVFTYGRHETVSRANTVTEKLPPSLASEDAVLARMAGVAITALRVADAEWGDTVAVLGLGLVGNLAAQLFAQAGCDVIGVDPSASRRRHAEACGISRTLSPDATLEDAIADLTRGHKCRTVVDATGVPRVIAQAPALAGKLGELILLGSPRGEFATDLTPFLNHVHLAGFGNITIKGAHEYRFPPSIDPEQRYRHSFQSHIRLLLERIADGRIKTRPLISHQVPPRDAAAVYAGLQESPEDYMAVVFDWEQDR